MAETGKHINDETTINSNTRHASCIFFLISGYGTKSLFLYIAGRYFFPKNWQAELSSETAVPLKCLLDKKEMKCQLQFE